MSIYRKELTPEEWEKVRAGQKEIANGEGISLENIENEFGSFCDR